MWEKSAIHLCFSVKWAANPGSQWAAARATSNCKTSCLLPIDLEALRGKDHQGPETLTRRHRVLAADNIHIEHACTCRSHCHSPFQSKLQAIAAVPALLQALPH